MGRSSAVAGLSMTTDAVPAFAGPMNREGSCVGINHYQSLVQRWYGSGKTSPGIMNTRLFRAVAALLAATGGILLWRRLAKRRASSRSSVATAADTSLSSAPRSVADLLHNRVTGWIILAVSVSLTILAWHVSNLSQEKRTRDRFDFKVEEARLAIQKRMREYEQVLRGGVGLFRASDQVTRQDWQRYVETLEIDTYWPGIQGIGFALMIAPAEKEALVRRLRAEGFDAFAIHPEGERAQYSAIIYLEPFLGRNLRAFGYDMFSETVRQEAMVQARDSGLPALSGRVTLVQETDLDVQSGFLMYLPVYQPGRSLETVAQRREAILGFVYSPFRVRDLMEGILGPGLPNLEFDIFDETVADPDKLLYSTRAMSGQTTQPASRYSQSSLLDLSGRIWLLRFASHPAFEKDMESHQSTIVALLGMLVDLLLFFIVLSLGGQKQRIQQRAKEIAQALNKAEIRYRRMVDNIKDVIFQTDIEGAWTFLNPAWEQVSGSPIQESLGKSFMAYVHPDDRKRAQDQFQHLILGTQDAFRDEFSGIHRSGQTVWVEVYATRQTHEDGSLAGVSGTLRDITLGKQAEDAMRKARDSAESASRSKSEFLANMSHELRTPLNSLLILSRLLTEADNLTPDQMESARVIHTSGLDLLQLINDILDLSKIEAGRMEVLPEALDLTQFRERILHQFQPLAGSRSLTLEVTLAPDLPATFVTDGHKLEQILRNLLSNACKFTERGGISLQIGRPAPDSAMIAFRVADTGIGIPADKHELIFETFRQVDGATSRKYGGTGLGLSISRKLAHLLQGTIGVDSREGQGSVFTLLLPELSSRMFAPAATDHPVPGFHAPWATLLVVDDDPRNRFALVALLADRVKTILQAENGAEALQRLQDHPAIDLVLMDIMMPVMDGFQAIQAIRHHPEWAALPIVALTAKAMAGDRERSLELGADDYLAKPVAVEHLLLVLQQRLGDRPRG
ncbi:MAG: CHASE domain-containing protein, partial [Magnetococcales bacterium]|nr:CHASE domain-containing protein [Magnetococcales bacterium]